MRLPWRRHRCRHRRRHRRPSTSTASTAGPCRHMPMMPGSARHVQGQIDVEKCDGIGTSSHMPGAGGARRRTHPPHHATRAARQPGGGGALALIGSIGTWRCWQGVVGRASLAGRCWQSLAWPAQRRAHLRTQLDSVECMAPTRCRGPAPSGIAPLALQANAAWTRRVDGRPRTTRALEFHGVPLNSMKFNACKCCAGRTGLPVPAANDRTCLGQRWNDAGPHRTAQHQVARKSVTGENSKKNRSSRSSTWSTQYELRRADPGRI